MPKPNSLIGQPAPDFDFTTNQHTTTNFSQLLGKQVVLYFYPKDNTPGCTQESKDFRDLHDEFSALDAIVLGVSRDSIKSHENFSRKHEFPFALISDTEELLCQYFGVIKEKKLFGVISLGIERSTFLINRQGIICKEWRKVKVANHAAAVLKAVAEVASDTSRGTTGQ